MKIQRIVPVLTVPDLAAATKAYVGLGMSVLMDHGWIVTLGDVADRSAQLSLMTRDLTARCNPAVSVEVDDVDIAHTSAVAEGLEIVHELTDEEWGVRRFFFRDPAGTVVNVLSHRA